VSIFVPLAEALSGSLAVPEGAALVPYEIEYPVLRAVAGAEDRLPESGEMVLVRPDDWPAAADAR
jgi:hypothetical protein